VLDPTLLPGPEFRFRLAPWLPLIYLLSVVIIAHLDVVVIAKEFAMPRSGANMDPFSVVRNVPRYRPVTIDIPNDRGT
jgi:hypothetical protein